MLLFQWICFLAVLVAAFTKFGESMQWWARLAGWLVGLAIVFAGAALDGGSSLVCSDGWESPSIGRMGACSHHGGVGGPGLIALLGAGLGVFSGVGVAARLDAWHQQRRDRQ